MNKKSGISFSRNFGSGYVSVIMLFLVICLTVLATLSLSAAGSNLRHNERSRTLMSAYYDAESRANGTLMKIDEAAYSAGTSGFFDTFSDKASQISGVTVLPCADGFDVTWSEAVNDRIQLECEAVVFREPKLHGGKRYETTKWKTVSGGAAETRVNVWSGTLF